MKKEVYQLKDHSYYIRRCIEVSRRSIEHGNTPFGAILVDPEGNILMEQENVEVTTGDCTGHAETTLAAKASKEYSKEFLNGCTLYSTIEPCVMCAGAMYWAGIGRLVYGASEERLLQETGSHPQNPTLSMKCRDVFASGQKEIEVIGPIQELVEEVMEVHKGYWT